MIIVSIMRIEINKHIVVDSEICGGTPTFKGTRIMVWQVLELLEAGVPINEIRSTFVRPLTEKHVKAALHYAVQITKGKNNVILSTAS